MTTPPTNQPFCVFITHGEFCDKLFPFLLLLVGFYTSSYSPSSFFIRCLFFIFLSCSIYKCCSFYQAKFMITRSRANQLKNSNYHCGRVPAVLYKRIVFTITLDLLSLSCVLSFSNVILLLLLRSTLA